MLAKRATPDWASLTSVALVALNSAGLTYCLYGSGTALPFYSDDLIQVLWTKATPLVDIWRTVNPYDHFRPVQFTLWRLLYLFTGDLRPDVLHALNLVGHVFCGMLVGLLSARWLGRSRLVPSLVAALFVAFPFGFDAVLWPCALAYQLCVGLSLVAVLLYLSARASRSVPRHVVAIVVTALAGFSLESGVVSGAMILLAEVAIAGRLASRWPLAYLMASAVPLSAVISVAPSLGLSGHHSINDLAVVVQTLAFPVAPLATAVQQFGVDVLVALLSIGLAALLLLVYGAHRDGQLRWLGFGFGWTLAWISVPLLTQQFDWLRDPPRVFYPSAAGVALIWGTGLAGLSPRALGRTGRCLGQLLLIGAIVPAIFFLQGRMELYQRVGDLLWEVLSIADERGSTLFVNVPGRITPVERFYPLGHEGVIPLPPPTNVDVLVEAHTGHRGVALQRVVGGLLPRLPYQVEIAGDPLSADDLRAAEEVVILSYRTGRPSLEVAGAVLPPQTASSAIACFGEQIRLLSASARRDGHGNVVLTTTWQAEVSVKGAPTIFAHLLDPDGTVVAQADGYPIRGLYPFAEWRPWEVVQDVRVFEEVGSSASTVSFGVWDPSAGVRRTAVAADGERLRDDAFRCEVQSR